MLPPTVETVGFHTTICMLDFVYVVTFEYEDEFEVVGAARTRKDAEEYIEKIILTLPLRNNKIGRASCRERV